MIFTVRGTHDTIAVMQAVLFDMDGTIVDSEKLWDISLAALCTELGGRLTPEVRASMVGGSAEDTIRTVYTDLGLDLDPVAMAASGRWLHDYTAELFDGGLLGAEVDRDATAGVAESQRGVAGTVTVDLGFHAIGRHRALDQRNHLSSPTG